MKSSKISNQRFYLPPVVQRIWVFVLTLLTASLATAQLSVGTDSYYASRSDASTTTHRATQSRASHRMAVDQDGWHAWTVDAIDEAPDWCCYKWNGDDTGKRSCQLDGKAYGVSPSDHDAVTNSFRIYAQREHGQITAIRAYSSSCPVDSAEPVTDHGTLSVDASVGWLNQHIGQSKALTSSALAAVAIHAGQRAHRVLVEAAHSSRPTDVRKQSIFWLGQVRARESVRELTTFMKKDDDDEIREHAVFSVSQSSLDEKMDLITAVAREDAEVRVRSQAWFWLAQTENPQAGQRIVDGMQSEASKQVLRQAVFALSQLPGDEAVNRLIEVAEHTGNDRAVRKQALFWLAQDGSHRATDYLASVLNR